MNIAPRKKRAFLYSGFISLCGILTFTLLYLFGWISFSNPANQLHSPLESDRFDALITIAEQGTNGIPWRAQVIQIMQTDSSPDIREMATITLRELGPSEPSLSALQSSLLTETNQSVQTALREVYDYLK